MDFWILEATARRISHLVEVKAPEEELRNRDGNQAEIRIGSNPEATLLEIIHTSKEEAATTLL